jgi:hypothetical protein
MQGNMPKKELETFRCDHRKLQSLSLDIQETIAVTVEPNDLACRHAEQNDEYESEAQRWSAICLSNYDVGKRRQRRSEPHQKGQSTVLLGIFINIKKLGSNLLPWLA